jgi:hypothetical protein
MSRRPAPARVESDNEDISDEIEAPLVGDAEDDDVLVTHEAANDDVGQEVGTHVSADSFKHKKTLFLDVDVDASPEELNANPKLAEWNLKQELFKHFKLNVSDKDRANATEDKLFGNIEQIVPLNLEVVEHQNSLPYKVDVHAEQHLMGKTVHRHGSSIWSVMPDTSPSPVGRTVFEPSNIFDARMYEKAQLCTLKDLDEDVKLTAGNGKSRAGFATVATGTAAYDRLLKGLGDGEWRKIALTERDLNDIYEPARHARAVNVPLALGEALKGVLRSDLQEVIDRCINLEDFKFTLKRADGRAWNSPQGLHGMLVGSGIDASQSMAPEMLQRNGRVHVRFLFTFLTL